MSSVQTKRPPDPDYVSNDALRLMCENVLQLLSTTVDNMDSVSTHLPSPAQLTVKVT